MSIGIDQSVQRYLEVARKLESFFLQQRLALSINKPEQLIREVHFVDDDAPCEGLGLEYLHRYYPKPIVKAD